METYEKMYQVYRAHAYSVSQNLPIWVENDAQQKSNFTLTSNFGSG